MSRQPPSAPSKGPMLVELDFLRDLLATLAHGDVHTFFYEDKDIKLRIRRGKRGDTVEHEDKKP